MIRLVGLVLVWIYKLYMDAISKGAHSRRRQDQKTGNPSGGGNLRELQNWVYWGDDSFRG